MKLRQYLKFSAIVFLTTLAAVATATPSFAQFMVGEQGQGGAFTAESVNGPLKLQGVYSEARNAGNLLSVWRGATNNQVWMSLN